MPYANLGVVDNKGFEATLEYTQQLGKKCFLTVRGNFSWNEDKIIENDDPRVQYPWMEKRGTNVNGRWGWIAEGYSLVKKRSWTMPSSLVKASGTDFESG